MKVWLNGETVAADEARISGRDRGFLLGDGVFDTLAAFDGRPFRLKDHLARLRRNAESLGIPLPYDDKTLEAAVNEVLGSQPAAALTAVRTTVTRGAGQRGLLPPSSDECHPTVMISAAAAAVPAAPARVIVSSVRRNEGSPASRIKSLSYLDNILARQEAAIMGADEAVMLNNRGVLACATAANIFILRGRSLFTPPVEDGVLAGVARAVVLEIAGGLGLSAHETSLAPEKLYEADDVFLTNSLIGVRCVSHIGAHIVRENECSGIVQDIREAWLSLIS